MAGRRIGAQANDTRSVGVPSVGRLGAVSTVVAVEQHGATAVELHQPKLDEAQQYLHPAGIVALGPQRRDPGGAPVSNVQRTGDLPLHRRQGAGSLQGLQLPWRAPRHDAAHPTR
jgi:hypothetical protein